MLSDTDCRDALLGRWLIDPFPSSESVLQGASTKLRFQSGS